MNKNNELPSKTEYEISLGEPLSFQEWSEPKYKCSECGGGMCKNNMVTLTTYPAMYEYRCNKCGHVDYLHQ